MLDINVLKLVSEALMFSGSELIEISGKKHNYTYLSFTISTLEFLADM